MRERRSERQSFDIGQPINGSPMRSRELLKLFLPWITLLGVAFAVAVYSHVRARMRVAEFCRRVQPGDGEARVERVAEEVGLDYHQSSKHGGVYAFAFPSVYVCDVVLHEGRVVGVKFRFGS